MAGKIYKMSEMTYPEIEALDKDRTIVFLAVSPVEVHGVHLPLKTDYYLAETLLTEAATKSFALLPDYDALFAPTLPVGSDVLPLPGSIEVRPRVLYNLLTDVGRAFARWGFSTIVIVSGHGGPRHNAAIELASIKVMRKHPHVRMFSPTSDLILYVLLGYFQKDLLKQTQGSFPPGLIEKLWPSDVHAGALETSLGLLFMPECVREESATLSPVLFHERNDLSAKIIRILFRTLGKMVVPFQKHQDKETFRLFLDNLAESIILFKLPGKVCSHAGYPAHASTELGRAYIDIITDHGSRMVQRIVNRTVPVESTFTILSRSWLIRMSLFFR